MDTQLRILIADEELDSIGFVTTALEGTGHALAAARSHPQALAMLARERFDVVMFDIWAETLPGLRLFEKARELHEYVEGIVVTGAVSIYSVLDCYRAGIIDYLAKPLQNHDAVRRAIERAAEKRRHWLGILKSLEYQKIGG
jgi:DNA-binding NtrC family response regulator